MSTQPLSELNALSALSALAQLQRLRAFRALVVAGSTGLTAGSLSQQLDVPPSSLSFHLKELARSGLIQSEQQGRYLLYRAQFAHMNDLLAYLTEHCCQGQDCGVTQPACAGD